MTLTKAEMSEDLANNITGLNKKEALEFIDNLFEEIKSALSKGEAVKISGLGNFATRDKSARPGRNPRTGEDKIISARRVVTFKAGQKLKAALEKGLNKDGDIDVESFMTED